MSIDRLLRANRTVVLIPMIDGPTEPLLVGVTGATTPFSDPSAAVIAGWSQITSTTQTGASNGGNISCALLDDLSLGLADSDTDDELTICSIGNESTPTFYNVDAAFTAFRDRNKADTGVFNLATQLLNGPDVRYAVLDRIGSSSTTTLAAGDIVSIFEMTTDNPVDVKEDRGNLKIQQTPNASGLVNVNKTLKA